MQRWENKVKHREMRILTNLVHLIVLAQCCNFAHGFQAAASDFKFVFQRKMTRANHSFAKSGTTIRATFEDCVSSETSNDDSSMKLLEGAISNDFSAAESLLTTIEKMRDAGESKEVETLLNNLLAKGPDASLPFWCKSKRLGRYSRRARMASLKRTLDMVTSPDDMSNVGSTDDDMEERRLFRRRRALLSLLRSLAMESNKNDKSIPAIVVLERRAIKSNKEGALDLRNRLPDGLETPDYEILTERNAGRGKIEIRRYKPYSVCSVSMNKPRPANSSNTDAKTVPGLNGASSFGALAGYLFGKNDKSTAMKMTTPVFTSPGAQSGDKEMQFVMPSEFWDSETLETAPQPLSGSGVMLKQQESQNRAVLMFGGYASKKEVDKRKKELLNALSKDKDWRIAEDKTTLAQYNDPFTLPWKRLNEVSILVEERN